MADRAAVVAAVQAGDVDALRGALAADPSLADATDEAGVSALLLALYHGHDRLPEVLAQHRELDVFEAAALGRPDRVAELLRARRTLALDWSPDGFTPLHYAGFFSGD